VLYLVGGWVDGCGYKLVGPMLILYFFFNFNIFKVKNVFYNYSDDKKVLIKVSCLKCHKIRLNNDKSGAT
jgi:hypothetical protein